MSAGCAPPQDSAGLWLLLLPSLLALLLPHAAAPLLLGASVTGLAAIMRASISMWDASSWHTESSWHVACALLQLLVAVLKGAASDVMHPMTDV